jgi:DNA invertase Pin-like site-specific DNA recombinase
VNVAVIGGYIRVSSRQQRDESDSPANQRARLEQAGATLFFEDLAVSGFKPERRRSAQGFRDLVAAIEGGHISRLLCTRIDRIARRDSIVLELADLCERRGVEFVSLGSGPVDTSTASGWLSVKMQLMLSEHFSRQLSENIKSGYEGAWARGKAARGPLPFHLQRDPECPPQEHKLVASPAWDDARRAARLAIDGASTSEIARFLREQGHIRSRTGVLNWLKNPLLRGHAGVWRDDAIRVLNVAPALITEAEHDKILAGLAANRSQWGANARSSATPPTITPLTRVCRCAACGTTLSQNRSGGRRRGDRTSPGHWGVRCRRDGCSAEGRSWAQKDLERVLALEWLAPQASRIAQLLIDEREARRRRRQPSSAEVALRQELRARERLPVEFRAPADAARIVELRQLIVATELEGSSPPRRGLLPSAPAQVALYRNMWATGSWVLGDWSVPEAPDPPLLDKDRNTMWLDLTDRVIVDLEARRVVEVIWRL